MSDLFEQVETSSKQERAKAAILTMVQNPPGHVLGAITKVWVRLDTTYPEAVRIVADLVRAGFISEADQDGRRALLEQP